MTELVAIVADTHINSSIGLSLPSVNLDDGGTYQASRGQRWLWECWIDFWDSLDSLARSRAADVTVIFNGDILEADPKQRTSQLISRNPADILRMASETIQPAAVLAKRIFFIRGTASHTGISANMEEILAADTIGAIPTDDGTCSWWKLLAEFGGVLLDVVHHGPLGRKP